MKKLLLSLVLMLAGNAFAAQLYPLKFHWNTTTGRASGYKVYTCEAGTSCGVGISANDKDTYTTGAQTATNTNPVVLDSRGEADIFFNGLYKIVICDSNDANCVTEDNWGYGYTTSSTSASPTNLIPNASFETDTNSDDTPDSWLLTADTGSTNTLDTSDQYHGAQSGKFVSVGTGGGYYTSESYIELTEGRTYAISFGVKSSVVDVRNLVQIQYFTSAKASVSTVSVWDDSATNPTSWTIKSFDLTPPATARYAKLIFYGAHSSDATAGTTRYDNLRMTLSTTHNVGRGIRDLVIIKASATTVDVDATYLTVNDDTNSITEDVVVNLTLDITASGLNGLDTGAEADTVYYVHVIYNETTVGGLLSLSSTAPTMPTGYTYARVIGFIRNDTDIVDFKQYGNLYDYTAWNSIVAGLTAAIPTAQSVASGVGTDIALAVSIGTSDTVGSNAVYLSTKDDTTSIVSVIVAGATSPYDAANSVSAPMIPLNGGVNVYFDLAGGTHSMYVKTVLLDI